MNSIRIKIGIFSFAMLALRNLAGCASMVLGFSARPISATVVDAETKEPLKDVIVVAHWQLVEGGFLDSSIPAGELMVMEAVTDVDGKFYFPAWGPKYVFMGRMKYFDPELILFKPGYIYKTLANEWAFSPIGDYEAFRSSDWDGKTIELNKATENSQEYGEHLFRLKSNLDSVMRFSYGDHDDDKCFWQKTPKIWVSMHKLSRNLENQGVKVFGSAIFRVDYIPIRKNCGDPVKFLREYFNDD